VAADPAAEAALFAMPRIAEETRRASGLIEAGDLPEAARILDGLIDRHPDLGLLRADRAVLAMLAGDPATALAELETAAARGFEGIAAFAADPLFAPLSADPRLAALAQAAAPPPHAPRPTLATGRRAPVTAANTAWNPATERLEARFAFPAEAAAPVLPADRTIAAYELLREHVRRGRAAGNHGDLYDNRDRDHSTLPPGAHPQLTRVGYSGAARAAGVDYGLNDSILFDRITLGNSSTALTQGALWRSLPRMALTRSDGTGPMRLWQTAAANHLYVYPAHRDYGPEHDLFPANTPYMLVSRGSSGSDQPILEAIAMILAAFRPVTKARLEAENLVSSTTQMVFRRSLQNVRSREAYFSGDAHPAAFEAFNINLARMVSLAQSILPGDIPAEARLTVVEEDLATEGVDYFGEGLSEVFFDTPSAIGRIWRSRTGRRTMILSAEASRDPNGRALAFDWRLLQGDPARVRIEPLDGGRRARVILDWHDPFRISDENPLTTSRVDIGVFASNGVHDSTPAILSWHFPPHEARRYETGPDGAPRIEAIDHAARPDTYADPMLLPRIDWRDAFRYDAAGAPDGWTRSRDGVTTDYTAEGMRVLTRDRAGRVTRAEPVRYVLRRAPDGGLLVEEIAAGDPRE